LVQTAWKLSPSLALNLSARFPYVNMSSELERLVRLNPKAAIDSPEALFYMLFSENIMMDSFRSKVGPLLLVSLPIEIVSTSHGSSNPH
jgi:hypothetical protein